MGPSKISTEVQWQGRARGLCFGVLRLGARDEQKKTNTFGRRDTAGGSLHILLTFNGVISHLYNRFQSAMVQGFLK